MLAALNGKLRRRNSHGGGTSSTGTGLPFTGSSPGAHQPKVGPRRSTKDAQKLKLLPTPEVENDDEESGRDVYSQYTRIKDPTARRDAARLGKADRGRLPRVTAYCTANKYQMDGLMRFLKGRGKVRGANPKLIDECIYTPYNYNQKQVESAHQERALQVHSRPLHETERRHSTGEVPEGDSGFGRPNLLSLDDRANSDMLGHGYDDENALSDDISDFDIHVHTPEVFLFEYGVVVIWGMTAIQEQRFLKEITKFEIEKLPADDMEAEYFNFYYTNEYQARIYNDFITLRDKNSYMTKLAISHALAQSVKASVLFSPTISLGI